MINVPLVRQGRNGASGSIPVSATAYAQQHFAQNKALQEELKKFWAEMKADVEKVGTDPAEFKSQQLPLARIKKVPTVILSIHPRSPSIGHRQRLSLLPCHTPPHPPTNKQIMKSDEVVRMISAEAPVLFAKACEFFILEATLRAWNAAEEHKRRTLQRGDIATAITRTEVWDFLLDTVPLEGEAAAAYAAATGINSDNAAAAATNTNDLLTQQHQQQQQQGVPPPGVMPHPGAIFHPQGQFMSAPGLLPPGAAAMPIYPGMYAMPPGQPPAGYVGQPPPPPQQQQQQE